MYFKENCLENISERICEENSIVSFCYKTTFYNTYLFTSKIVDKIIQVEIDEKNIVFKGHELLRINFLGLSYCLCSDFDAIIEKKYVVEGKIIDYNFPLLYVKSLN